MKSLSARYSLIAKSNPLLGNYIVFSKAVRNQNFSEKTIRKWFNKLLDENDYDLSDKKVLLKQQLDNTSKVLEEVRK